MPACEDAAACDDVRRPPRTTKERSDARAGEKTSLAETKVPSRAAAGFAGGDAAPTAVLNFELPNELSRRKAAAAGRRILEDREAEPEVEVVGDARGAWLVIGGLGAGAGAGLDSGFIRGIRECDTDGDDVF